MTLESIVRPFSTTAIAVSSQEDSTARIRARAPERMLFTFSLKRFS